MARNQIISAGAYRILSTSGPFVDSNDNVYLITAHGTTFTPAVFKAGANPSSGSWTEQDSAGAPGSGVGVFAAVQDGSVIHVIQYRSSGTYSYSAFGMSDNGSADQWIETDTTIEAPTNPPTIARCGVCVRSDGDIIVFYQGDLDKIMGTDYERTDYALEQGSGWTSVGNSFAIDTVEFSHHFGSCGINQSTDLAWGSYRDDGGSPQLVAKSLNSSNSLGSAIQLVSGTFSASGFACYYDDSGVEVMSFSAFGSGNDGTVQLRDGTAQTKLDFATNRDGDVCVAVTGTDLYGVISDTTTDLYYYQLSSDGGSYGSQSTLSTATAAGTNRFSVNIIDHGGGTVLAIIYLDGAATYYEELSVGTAPEISPARIVQINRAVADAVY